MRRLRAAGLFVLVVAAACGDAGGNAVREVHGLVAADAQVDFGDVALGKESRKTFSVHNDGLVRATVDRLPGATVAAPFSVNGLPLVLGPAAHQDVEVVFKPEGLGAQSSQVDLTTDAPGQTPRVTLRGNAVRGLVQLSGDAIDFGPVVVNEQAQAQIMLVNNDGHALTTIQVAPPQGNGAAAFSTKQSGSIDLTPDQTMPLVFVFQPTQVGDFQATVDVTPCPTCGPRPVTLTGRGVTSLLAIAPPAIDFGDVLLGSTAAQAFAATNISKSPLTITSVGFTSGQYLSIALDGRTPPVTLAPNETITGTVTFAPTDVGQQAAQAQIAASDGAPGVLDVKGLGMGPVMQVRPLSLYVGATALGTTRSATVTVTNVGLDPRSIAPLQLTGISLEAPDTTWGLASPQAAAVGEPGSSFTVTITYSPTVAGLASASLVLLSNDAMHPRIVVPLTALARDLPPCQIAFSANPVDFGYMRLFDPSTQGFEIYNQTGDDCIVGDPQLITQTPAFRWPGGVAPSGRTLPPGGRMSVRVQFEAESAGRYFAAVEFYLSNKNAQRQHVDLTGVGIDTCFFITPGTLDFGPSTQGCTNAPQVAFAVNHCAAPVTITSVATSGPPFSPGALALPIVVAPNTSAQIPVQYAPQTIGDDVGWLQVSASSNAQPYQIGLTGGVLPSGSASDEWDQSTPKVDLLIVIDNSASMLEEQRALANNLDKLWSRIAIANADFHIAVTTTGMIPYSNGLTLCPGGADGGEAGRFFPVDNSRPRILTPTTPNVKDVLFANTNVGQCHWKEQFVEPVTAALTAPLVSATKAPGTQWPNDGNAGFLRDDARLALLAVSDTDGDSDLTNPPPTSTFIDTLRQIKHGALDLVSFSAIVPLHNCTATAEGVGYRYMEMAKALNGHVEDICDLSNFGNLLESSLGNLLMPLTSFPLSKVPREASAIHVTINGAAATGWTYDAQSNRIVFEAGSVPPPGSHIAASYTPACP